MPHNLTEDQKQTMVQRNVARNLSLFIFDLQFVSLEAAVETFQIWFLRLQFQNGINATKIKSTVYKRVSILKA